jgi:hypothetical protein
MSAFQTPKFLHISFYWAAQPKTKELDVVFNDALDWIRYSPNCWIVWTTTDSQGWYNRLVNHITTVDRVFICELNVTNKHGWMDKWVWEWFQKVRPIFGQPMGN